MCKMKDLLEKREIKLEDIPVGELDHCAYDDVVDELNYDDE